MSERSSLSTQYFYDMEDLETIKTVIERNSSGCLYDTNIPILCCYVNVTSASNCDWLEVFEWFENVKTNDDIRFSLIQEGGSTINFIKTKDGKVIEDE